jgi:hypothetical protein
MGTLVDEHDKIDSLRWPQHGDRPSQSGFSSSGLAVDMDWARGWAHAPHLRAASLLFESLSHSPSEMLVFPYLFLCRQHIELDLKRLIVLVRRVLDIDEGPPRGHKLPPLWRTLRSLLETDEELDGEVLRSFDAAGAIIDDLERIDPNSIHSRYAEGFTADFRVESLADLPRHFDIAHFHDVLSGLSNLLECVDAEFATRLEHVESEAVAR